MGLLLLLSCGLASAAEPHRPTRVEMVRMSDGVEVAVALHIPPGGGRFPALLAASPYRLDNDIAPAIPLFLQRETGPVEWYMEQGYAFVRLDTRGTGRSGGVYRYQDKLEQQDLHEVIEWIARQPWSTGKVGGIGQSYYARMQWFMAAANPPHLSCIAPFDGNIDTYRASAYTGGILGRYPFHWFASVSANNLHPSEGAPRILEWNYPLHVQQHPLYDDFWKERSVAEHLHKIKVPVFSIGVWSKVDLHLNGNIVGYQRSGGPKKLLVLGAFDLYKTVAEYSSVEFHEKYMLPFYDWCLKGRQTSYVDEPEVRYFVNGADAFRSADRWPPRDSVLQSLFLNATPSGSVTSLNDGSLVGGSAPSGAETTVFNYPDHGWINGVIGRGPQGGWDPVRRVITYTTPPLENDLEVAGPSRLVLYVSSTNRDADFFVKLSDQLPQSAEDRAKGLQPRSANVTKGWLRASHRRIDESASMENAPWYTHDAPQYLVPGQTYKLEIAIMPTAHLFKRGHRIRLEIANGDSPQTEGIFHHFYTPDKLGQDTFHHAAGRRSELILPVRKP